MSPVNVNPGEFKSVIGLDDLYVAAVTADTAAAYTADTPEYLAPAAMATQSPEASQEIQYADNQPYDVMTAEGPTVVDLDITGLPPEMYAKVLGKVFNAASGRVFDNQGTPPEMALSFRTLKSNGSYRYIQFLRGKFSIPSEEAATRTASADPKTTKLTYTALPTIHPFNLGSVIEPVKRVFGDQDTTSFSGTGWFTVVQTPVVVAPASLELSSADPVDGAAAVAITKTIVLTFNNALINNAIYNVAVVKADGAIVACTNSLDATKKIMTINPDSNLSGATTYIVTYAVIDIYGDTLIGAVNFATA